MASGNQQQACHLGYPSFCVVAVPSLSCVQFFCDLMECSPRAPLSMGFPR